MGRREVAAAPRMSGIVSLAKPAGITSRDAVNRLQQLVRPNKVGHAGTLDPLATGVLVVCVGHATRLVPYIQDGRKRYRAGFRLGETSDSDDVTGAILQRRDARHVTRELLEVTLREFVGRIDQVPPQVSAVHVDGQRAYDLARKGVVMELAARPVEIVSITLETFQGDEFQIEVVCGGGTYIRAIGRDVGERLGCGAVMTSLVREGVGPFELATSVAPDELSPATLSRYLQSPLTAVAGFPRYQVDAETLGRMRCGQQIACPDDIAGCATEIAVLDPEGNLAGLARFHPETQRLAPHLVFPADA